MNSNQLVTKDEFNETLVPTEWRKILSEIVLSFVDCDYQIKHRIAGVLPLTEKEGQRVEKNIVCYGATLVPLSENTWDTSVCQWMLNYWNVMVDLYTLEEGASDLVLFVHVSESSEGYIFKVHSVHVP